MSDPIQFPFFCWCGMCGYTATVRTEDVARVSDDCRCPDCEEMGMLSLLECGPELPDYIAPDDPMPEWPQTVDDL